MKKKVILITTIFILLILDSYLFFNFIYAKYRNKIALENSDVNLAQDIKESNFKIGKIILYSSASGINKNTNFQSTNWILDIFQYTDIAIYFSKPENLNATNTIKNLSISNINYIVASEKYTPELYYLDGNNFGTDTIVKDHKIEKTLEYTVLNSDNKENSIMYNTPVFFSDLSNPITLKFINNLLKNYQIKNTEKLIFDGTLLSKTPLTLKNLKSSISFNINITNYNDENYSAPISVEIPIQNSNENILQGKVLETKNLGLTFLKEKSETSN